MTILEVLKKHRNFFTSVQTDNLMFAFLLLTDREADYVCHQILTLALKEAG